MPRAIQNEKGEWIAESTSWGLNEIKEARKLLKLRFDDVQLTPEVVQEIINALIIDFGNDPKEIERVITQHFKKRKG